MTPLLAQMHAEHRARLMRLGCIPAPKPRQPKLRVIEQPKQPEPVVPPAPPRPIHFPPAPRHANPLYPGRLADAILNLVAQNFGMLVGDILRPYRGARNVRARHVAIYLLNGRGWSTTRLGNYFDRDHTTVLHACRKIEIQRNTDPDLRERLSYLEAQIKEATEKSTS